MTPQKPAASAPSLVESLAIPTGIIMLVLWAIGTFALSGPGWLHLFLTLGVFLVIWGIVARGDPKRARASGAEREARK
ncbi:MAG TPA: hypothetical protein VFS05_14840 [Gemmatimonadaceae bacterium]|nr:hypothetical protein [Gemmatimonadaceae bacterium]